MAGTILAAVDRHIEAVATGILGRAINTAHTNNECWARQRADWVTHLTNLTGPQPAEDPAAARA
jgi:hypothetical protein